MYPNPPWNLLPSPPAAFSFHHCLRLLLFLHLILLPAHCEVTDFRVFFSHGASRRFACFGQVRSGDMLFVCECDFFILQLCNIRITKKKATVWSSCGWDCVIHIFAPYLWVCVCVCVSARECVCVCMCVRTCQWCMCLFFNSQILDFIRHVDMVSLNHGSRWLFWLSHGFSIGHTVALMVLFFSFFFLFVCFFSRWFCI